MLDKEKLQLLEKRKEQFEDIHHQRVMILIGFLKDLEFENPSTVMFNAAAFLNPLSDWMKTQTVSPENRNKVMLRFAYFIGEYLLQHYRGDWYVNELVQSKNFAKIVVGKFDGIRAGVSIDPFAVAEEYVDSGPGRDLTVLLQTICKELDAYRVPK